MISLVRRGKVPISEDVLTAAVFDYVRLLPTADLMRKMFAAATPVSLTAGVVPAFDACDVTVWPPGHPAGEPDVLLVLRNGAKTVARCIVEAKLGAGKSGVGELSEDGKSGDQLARYLLAEAARCADDPTFLLYLTGDAGCPWSDLQESRRWLTRKRRADLADRLLWLSWRDVEGMFRAMPPNPYLQDLQWLFERTSMFRFAGMELAALAPLGAVGFYVSTRSRSVRGSYPAVSNSLGTLDADPWRYQDSYNWPVFMPLCTSPHFYGGNNE